MPSISNAVQWEVSPTSSISPVLIHLCELVSLLPNGCFSPFRNGTKGNIPAFTKRTEASSSGTNGALGISAWFLALKKLIYSSLSSIYERFLISMIISEGYKK